MRRTSVSRATVTTMLLLVALAGATFEVDLIRPDLEDFAIEEEPQMA